MAATGILPAEGADAAGWEGALAGAGAGLASGAAWTGAEGNTGAGGGKGGAGGGSVTLTVTLPKGIACVEVTVSPPPGVNIGGGGRLLATVTGPTCDTDGGRNALDGEPLGDDMPEAAGSALEPADGAWATVAPHITQNFEFASNGDWQVAHFIF